MRGAPQRGAPEQTECARDDFGKCQPSPPSVNN